MWGMELGSSRRQLLTGAGLTGMALAFPGAAWAASPARVPGSVDLSSRNPAELDHYLAPTVVDGRDSAEFWAWCHCGSIAINSMAVEQVGTGRPNLSRLTITYPGGRILRDFVASEALPRESEDAIRKLIGTGTMRLESGDAYRRYRTVFKGTALDTSYGAILEGRTDARRVEVEIEVDYDAIVPVWLQGSMKTGMEQNGAKLALSSFAGGQRMEQLMRTSGRVVADGVETSFTGGGVRVHRQDIRALTAGRYVWQAACFPSGRAFSTITYAGPDGVSPSYAEGAVFLRKDRLVPARATQVPWIEQWSFNRGDVSLVLETSREKSPIKGTILLAAPVLADAVGGVPARQQAMVRYEWDGEISYGLIDRTFPLNHA